MTQRAAVKAGAPIAAGKIDRGPDVTRRPTKDGFGSRADLGQARAGLPLPPSRVGDVAVANSIASARVAYVSILP